MNPEVAKRELARLFTEAQSYESLLWEHNVDWAEQSHDDGPPYSLIDRAGETVEPFKYLATSLYWSTVCLLDQLKLGHYLAEFREVFGTPFDAAKAANDFELEPYFTGEHYNVFLSKLRQFLKPLDVLGDESRYRKLTGIRYLETILKNTAVILKDLRLSPRSEAQVYSQVKHVVHNVFPTARKPSSRFNKAAQEYIPDILIPELSAVVEYKYADDESKLRSLIAGISDDVKGYTDDDTYHLFYAVFYLTRDFWGQEKFAVAWNEKKFPENWIPIYVVGE